MTILSSYGDAMVQWKKYIDKWIDALIYLLSFTWNKCPILFFLITKYVSKVNPKKVICKCIAD